MKKITPFLAIIIILNLFIADSKNTVKVDDASVIEIGAYNVRRDNNNNYLIDIYASNNEPIAGLQFEIEGQNFEILNVDGGRAERAGFTFYNGKKGVVLAFSLQGKLITEVDSVYKKMNPLFTVTARKKTDIKSEFKFKTLVAGQKGVKLPSNFVPIYID